MNAETAIFSALKTGVRIYSNLDFLAAWSLFKHLQIVMGFFLNTAPKQSLVVLTAKNIALLLQENP